MKIIIFCMGVVLLLASGLFADDVSIDESGNVTTGTSNSNANLEVTGASAEDAIFGTASGTGAAGVYGGRTDNTNYGILGYDNYGVYGFSSSGYSGYFEGDARITGNLIVDGTFSGETDPQVGILTDSMWCTSDGTQVNCTTDAPLTTESDPTVLSSVKDGISWSEVSSRPAGLDDGDDVGITSQSMLLVRHRSYAQAIRLPNGTEAHGYVQMIQIRLFPRQKLIHLFLIMVMSQLNQTLLY
jgi:hypothetical protein